MNTFELRMDCPGSPRPEAANAVAEALRRVLTQSGITVSTINVVCRDRETPRVVIHQRTPDVRGEWFIGCGFATQDNEALIAGAIRPVLSRYPALKTANVRYVREADTRSVPAAISVESISANRGRGQVRASLERFIHGRRRGGSAAQSTALR